MNAPIDSFPADQPESVSGITFVQLTELTHSTTPRRAFLVAGIFAAPVVALLGFVYLKTKADPAMRFDRMIAPQMNAFAALSPERRLGAISDHLKQDPRRVELAGLFGSNGRLIAGNLEACPPISRPIIRCEPPRSNAQTKLAGRNRRFA
jgi:hypothetical protein